MINYIGNITENLCKAGTKTNLQNVINKILMKFSFFLWMFSLFAFSAIGQINKNGIPFSHYYSSEEYNAEEQNWVAVQDYRGVMYFANNNHGIMEYDGVSWQKIEVRNNSNVRSMDVSDEGTIYVGATGEFGYIAPDQSTGTQTYYSLSSALDSADSQFQNVWKTYSVGDEVYFCSVKKIFKYTREKLVKVLPLNEQYCFYTFYDNGKLYVGNYLKGLMMIENDTLVLAKGGDFFAKKSIATFLHYSDSLRLVGVNYDTIQSIYLYNVYTGSVVNKQIIDPMAEKLIQAKPLYHGIKLPDNKYAFATLGNGCIVIDQNGKIINWLNKTTGVKDETVTYLFHNRTSPSGALWLNLNSGIYKSSYNSPINFFSEESGLIGSVMDIIRFKGVLYVATSDGVFHLYHDEYGLPKFKAVGNVLLPMVFMKYDVPDNNDELLLLGTQNGLFEIIDQETVVPLEGKIDFEDRPVPNEFLYTSIYDIRTSAKKPELVYLITDGLAVLTYTKGEWKEVSFLSMDELRDTPRNIAEDSVGNVWLGMEITGFTRLRNIENQPVIDRFGIEEGLPALGSNFVYQIDNNLLFITTKGIFRMNNETGKFYPETSYGDRYSSGSTGVYRLIPEDNSKFWLVVSNNPDSSMSEDFQLRMWIETVGLNEKGEYFSDDTPFKILPNIAIEDIYFDDDKLVWIGNSKGIYSYDQKVTKDYKKPFLALIRKVILNGETIIFKGSYFTKTSIGKNVLSLIQPEELKPVLDFTSRNITFHFACPFFEMEEAIEYSYLLEGNDVDWSKWSIETYKDFTNLEEGDYVFKVKAKNIYGVESETATYEFSILPPWYRTIWAYIIYVILAVFIIILIVKLYTRKLEMEKIRLEGIVKERTAEVVRQKEDIEKKNEILEEQKEEITHQRDHIAHINHELTDSILYAKRIQGAILPHDNYVQEIIPDHFILFKPKDIVSGDFYWATKLKNQVIAAAADCTGHGVPGAFMSMLGVAFLNEVVKDKPVFKASQVLDGVRQHVINSLQQTGKVGEQKDGMDMGLFAIDEEKKVIQFAGANNSMYLVRKKEFGNQLKVLSNDLEEILEPNIENEEYYLFEIRPDKMPIAIYVIMEQFTNNVIELLQGDTVYMFTDGFADQFGGEKGKKFKYKPFKMLLLECQKESMPKQRQLLDDAIEHWKAFTDIVSGENYEQVDDICVLGMRFSG